ncbi:MAG: MaoC/PaaZ C-terminal domain-containing protein, partial [Acidimicrobiia bacterium]
MPIEVDSVVGADLPAEPFSWDESDVILYNLAVGAGDPPTDPEELKYAYEGDLRVVPGFGTIPPFQAMMGLGSVPGIDINLAQILHGSQDLTVHQPIPVAGSVTQSGRIVDVYDRGKGALIVIEVTSVLEKTGEPLFTNRASIYVRGEGGFGGDRGPEPGDDPPGRDPDRVVVIPTLPQQALLYRIASGDRNPLHADPGFAAFAGFERPILHGLCTFGMVARAVVDAALAGEPERMGGFRARFSGHVFPGETLLTSMW